ncbi:MAG: AAA family ATPase, partial [Anaerolineae bacterium]|nr:AAA family ATPase [Anaerolineae bacterium]
GALSGGMRQRLALALALLADPPVLLLDEPTSNLDAATRAEFLDLLAHLHATGKTLLFTSHHLAELEQLADQVLILQDGAVAAYGTPAALMPLLNPQPVSQRGEPRVPATDIRSKETAGAHEQLAPTTAAYALVGATRRGV